MNIETLAIILFSISLLIGAFTLGHMCGYEKGIKYMVNLISNDLLKEEESEGTEDEQAD